MPATHTCMPATHASMPVTHDLKRLRCLRRRQRCLQPTFCRACDGCGEEEDACNPCFPLPAVPATTTGVPATHADMPGTHDLKHLRCLRRRQRCLQPAQARSAMPAWRKRMPATPVFPCRRCLRRRQGCLQPAQACLQPMFCSACGACGDDKDACNPCFPVPVWNSGGSGRLWSRNCSFFNKNFIKI